MNTLAIISGIVLILVVLQDGFETVVLPRRVMQRVRLARLFYKVTWLPWSSLARKMRGSSRREGFLSFYGPLYLISLIGVWAVVLVLGFGAVYWGLGSELRSSYDGNIYDFFSDLYMSGATFFTLGFGDITPASPLSRAVSIMEAGLGFSFLALIIGYLPALNGAFSAREVNVSLLDGRAGSPPTAVALLSRHCRGADTEALKEFLRDWERWSAQLLESQLSYPVLGYFRSQHEHQSWVAALTVVLDTCALVMAGPEGEDSRQAQLTFAMARHAAVDLSQIFETPPRMPAPDRLPPSALAQLIAVLDRQEMDLLRGENPLVRLAELRRMYEPYVYSLSEHLLMPLPPWLPEQDAHDAWETTAWER